MAVVIPGIVTEESKNFVASIRLLPDGLSFSGYNPNIKGSFFFSEVSWRDAPGDPVDHLKRFFLENEVLTKPFRHLSVVQTQGNYALVPLAFYLEQRQEELFTFACGPAKGKVLAQEIRSEKIYLVYEMCKETYEFCSRSLSNPHFIHAQGSVLSLWKKLSLRNLFRQLYVSVSGGRMEAACFEQGRLLFSNYFAVQTLQEMLFYTLYIYKQLQLDVLRDQVKLCGDPMLIKEFRTALQTYIKQVDLADIPSEVYLMGTDMLRAPIDVIALSLYENY